jgi:tripartite-type tricarboxylate transporter receptor subunit TctC
MLTRRRLLALSAIPAFAPGLLIREGRAQTPKPGYPGKPVRIIVPVAAGGPTDIVARMLAERLSTKWGQQVFIENKPGAGNNIFSLVTRTEYFMFVPNSSPARTLEEFIEYVRSRPDQLSMASPGTGSAPYLGEMLFLQMADLKMTHVPYRGAAPAFSDLIPGRVDCYFGSGTLLSYSRSGQVRVLASTGPTRNAATPHVPAIAEYVPGYELVPSQALFVPARTPPEIVGKISADTNAVLAEPTLRDKLTEMAYAAGGSSPAELGALLKSEIERWSALVKSLGIKLD